MGRYIVTDETLERLKSFVKKYKGETWEKVGTYSPRYTVDMAIGALLDDYEKTSIRLIEVLEQRRLDWEYRREL
jgi:hypothetical protein